MMISENLSCETGHPSFISTLENLKQGALEGNGEAFYLLLEKAFYEEPGAMETFHEVVMSHPSHFYRFAQFFSHPQLSEVVLKIVRDPSFDLSPLSSWVETEPALLLILSGLALEKNHVAALKMLPQLRFDLPVYQKAVEEDPAYAAFLSLIAERGYVNVRDLLIQLVQGANQEVFFAFVGVAAEGSLEALQALNEGATVEHLIAMVDFARRYEKHPEFTAPLMRVVRDERFCPRELWNPSSQEILKEKGIESILFDKESPSLQTEGKEDVFPLKKASGI
jgi:hypothetical protein